LLCEAEDAPRQARQPVTNDARPGACVEHCEEHVEQNEQDYQRAERLFQPLRHKEFFRDDIQPALRQSGETKLPQQNGLGVNAASLFASLVR
jgi:hypothetical protein